VGILYVLDQTDEGFRPHELSIYTQGNVAMLFYESILLLVNIRLLMMMQYDTIGAKYSNMGLHLCSATEIGTHAITHYVKNWSLLMKNSSCPSTTIAPGFSSVQEGNLLLLFSWKGLTKEE